MSLASLWLIAGVILMVSEFVIPGFVIVFFGLGAVITSAVAAFLDVSLVIQGYIFIISSLLTLFLGRRYFRNILTGKIEVAKTDADDDGIVGSVCTVSRAIEPPQAGRVIVQGSEWQAVATRPIAAGSTVKIVAKKNITLTVE